MRIVFAWFDVSGYMAACWRALAARPGIDLKVVAFQPDPSGKAPFDPRIMQGLEHRLLSPQERLDSRLIADEVAGFNADVVIVAGWAHPPYVRLFSDARFVRTQFGMAMDTPWRGTWRQKLGRWKIRRFGHRLKRVIVAGERSFLLARNLGISESVIRRGTYGYDDQRFGKVFEARSGTAEFPKRFLFTGMFDRRKGLDCILKAYQMYRSAVSDPWPLSCCGTGEMNAEVSASPGVRNLGFVQPDKLPEVFAEHGVFVLASRYEPWGVVIAEALASGMPVICTEACGASVELVRSYYNGLTIPTGDCDALCASFKWMHEHHHLLREMGRRGRVMAEAFGAEIWATRITEMFNS